MDRCYVLSGILLDDSGEEVGIRYQEFELGDSGLLRVSSTVVCKKEEVSDFLLSHEVYGGGDVCSTDRRADWRCNKEGASQVNTDS